MTGETEGRFFCLAADSKNRPCCLNNRCGEPRPCAPMRESSPQAERSTGPQRDFSSPWAGAWAQY